jgi:hypothetical protein
LLSPPSSRSPPAQTPRRGEGGGLRGGVRFQGASMAYVGVKQNLKS